MPIPSLDPTRRELLAAGVAAGPLERLVGSATHDPDAKRKGDDSKRDDRKSPIPDGTDDHLGPDRYVVGTTSTEATADVEDRADAVARVLEFGARGDAVVGRFDVDDLDEIRRRCDVRYVEPDRTVRALQQTVPWGIERIGARRAAERGIDGAGADVSIIDTGIDSRHPDLRENLGAGRAIVSCTGTCPRPWDDDDGHGTHVAGTVSAVDNDIGVVGASPRVTLHAVKVLDSRGGGTTSGVAQGITWTADRGYDVANLSLGGPAFSQVLADACAYAYNRGVLLVGAAGNDSRGPVSYPAALPTVIAVSSTTRNDALSPFSNVGPEIELAAPGSSILSTVPGGYQRFSGTSMAAPHVSGAAALLMARGQTNAQARNRLRATAEDIGLSSAEQGHGLVNAAAATRALSVGELGSVTTDQPNRNEWHSVSFRGRYDSPVVIVNPVSSNTNAPIHARVRNVTRTGFEFQLERWRYLPGRHPTERVSYLVLESGTHTLQDGRRIAAGRTTASHRWRTVQFPQPFDSNPVVFTQSLTVNERDPIVTRQRPPRPGDFRVRVQEEEAGGAHAAETVGWVATLPGTGTADSGIPFEIRRTPRAVTHRWHSTSFRRNYGSSPHLVGTFQTFADPDPAELRYRNLTATGVQFRAREEQSATNQTSHDAERVGYLVASGSGLL